MDLHANHKPPADWGDSRINRGLLRCIVAVAGALCWAVHCAQYTVVHQCTSGWWFTVVGPKFQRSAVNASLVKIVQRGRSQTFHRLNFYPLQLDSSNPHDRLFVAISFEDEQRDWDLPLPTPASWLTSVISGNLQYVALFIAENNGNTQICAPLAVKALLILVSVLMRRL